MENTQKKVAIAFNPLDLQFKPKPKKKEENVVKVNIAAAAAAEPPKKRKVATAAAEDEEGEAAAAAEDEEGEAAAGDEGEEGEAAAATDKPPKVEIIDKRAEANINRRLILENLQKYNFVAAAAAAAEKEKPFITQKTETIAATAAAEAAAATDMPPPPPPPKKTIKIIKKGKTVNIDAAAVVPAAEEQAVLAAAPAPPKKGRKTAAPPRFATVTNINKIVIGDTIIGDRLPEKKEPVLHRIPKYYMNNRKLFLQSMNELLQPYKNDLDNPDNEGELKCERSTNEVRGLLTHQKVVRDYLNLYTPYRGLLLYHGLGSGKCQAKGTPIMMSDGTIKLVEDIKIGDLLMGDDSKPRTVLSLAQGRDEMYDIIQEKGDKYTVNQEHILCLKAPNFPFIYNLETESANDEYEVYWIEHNNLKYKKIPKNEAIMLYNSLKQDDFTTRGAAPPQNFENCSEDNVLEIEVNDYLKLPGYVKRELYGYKAPIEILPNGDKIVKEHILTSIQVKHIGLGDYYGFTLDGNCRYLFGDTTVTHNTCSSIAIAEGMKSQKQIYIMTPASLRMNYFNEIKKCGEDLYRKTQFWEFISTTGHPEYVSVLSAALSLPIEFIERKRGAWLVNVTKKEENFSKMDATQQKSIIEQIDAMIQTKYISINYNGLNNNRMETLTQNYTINPFDNSVIVVDEAHNLVSRIVNKLNQKKSISYKLYQYMMNAQNARIVFLSGTPIINYPNEISVLFNILRGYINTWTIPIKDPAGRKLTENTFISMFSSENLKTYDYVAYSGNNLTITRNPFGFSNTKKPGKVPANIKEEDQAFYKYDGLTMDENNRMSDDEFLSRVISILRKNEFQVPPADKIENTKHLPLPDNSSVFLGKFVDKEGNVMKIDVLKKRILGLTSYFRSAQEKLLPQYDKDANFHVIECPMSDYQFGKYAEARRSERLLEKNKKRKTAKRAAVGGVDMDDVYEDVASTYRVMSRAFCNFVFPEGITRPVPERVGGPNAAAAAAAGEELIDEDDLDGLTPEERMENVDGRYTADDAENLKNRGKKIDPTYMRRISKALEDLKARGTSALSEEALATYSPKFLHILDNLRDPNHIGLHLLYTTFRTVEGIGIMKLVLEQNGFAEFKIHKSADGSWDIIEEEDDIGKPKFALYTGTETAEEKEMLRNIYNGNFDNIPYALAEKIRAISTNNLYGEVIKIFMITAAGAEGINLENTRYVHITEPYWHPVRTEQVIGRARRICSHASLPEELRTVTVFLYLATFTEEQSTGDADIELREHDRARDPNVKGPITTDEYLYEVSNIKDRVTQQILRAVKETSMDCSLYNRKLGEKGENLVCYSFKGVKSNAFGSYPSLEEDEAERMDMNVRRVEWEAIEAKIRGKKYAIRKDTNELYDYDEYKLAQKVGQALFPIGKLNIDERGKIANVEFYGAAAAPQVVEK